MRRSNKIWLLAVPFALTACGMRSSATVAPVAGARTRAIYDSPANAPENVLVTTQDITDRPYRSLGDITAEVSKRTLFDADPTPAMVDKALQAKAAALGADAVVLVRYGTVGIGFSSWGILEGKGRAVEYEMLAGK